MSYKLIAIDMDGTLLNNSHKVSAKNREVITKLADQGVGFILASGRPYQSLHPYTNELEIYLPLVSANGSIIKCSLTDKVYNRCNMPLELVEEILEYGLDEGYKVSVYFEDELITFSEEMVKGHQELEGLNPKLVDKIELEEAPIKIIYSATKEMITEAFKDLSNKYEDRLYITRSDDIYLEVMNLEVSKGNALKYMMDRMDVDAKEVMAIGNNFNDVAMFDIAGFAVAMGNSPQEVKEKADFVTKTNQEDGVAYALEELILNNKQS